MIDVSAQELVFETMRKSEFNMFQAEPVIAWLKVNSELWCSCYWTRDYKPLLVLWDLSCDRFCLDTLFVLCTDEASAQRIIEVSKRWRADEADVVPAQHESVSGLGLGGVVVRLWWD